MRRPLTTVAAPVVEAAPVRNPFAAADAEPAPTVTASLAPSAAPAIAEERPLLFAPMVFEAPKPADAQVLTAMPQTEVVSVAPQPAAAPVAIPLPAARPVQQTSLAAEPSPVEFSEERDAYPSAAEAAVVVGAGGQPRRGAEPGGISEEHDAHPAAAETAAVAGAAARTAGQGLRQGREVPGPGDLFRGAQRPARGQQAVAQVVLNRVFSPYYPKDVCSVVYQNAHRHLSCQFTFACDGKPERVNEHGAWARANRIATQTLNAKVWLPEVDKATHYHAAYVRPNWIRDMKIMVRTACTRSTVRATGAMVRTRRIGPRRRIR